MKSRIGALGIVTLALFAAAPVAFASDVVGRTFPWSDEALDLARTLPIQEGGRIKPLSTYARFTLIATRGAARAYTADGEKLSPTEWILDTMLYPDVARTYPVFLVQDSEVLDDLRLTGVIRKKRDRYSYMELLPARTLMLQKYREYRQIPTEKQTNVQHQIVLLVPNYFRVESLLGFLDFAENPSAVHHANALAMIPPAGSVEEAPEWYTRASLAEAMVAAGDPDGFAREKVLLGKLADVALSRNDPVRLLEALKAFHRGVVDLARSRGEYGTVPLEVTYYRGDFLTWALVLFLVGFVLLAVTWMAPRATTWLYRGSNLIVFGGFALVTLAIVLRCIIRSRPPVSTLYETILFITATAVISALAIEWMNRKRIAVVLAAFLGAVGMFLAQRYEMKDGADTMPSLMAVLDTNFWLSTHVTTVTLGYSASLLASAIAHVYVLSRIVGFRKDRPDYYRSLARMNYGVLGFAIIFATLGTMLGGVWANESWGRFWGWDPKENGALMIVLWLLVIIHLRLGGFLRDFGVAQWSILGGIVVGFSWWGVNLLGVGLHSYGFTSGLKRVLYIAMAGELAVVLAGTIHYFATRPAAAPVNRQ